MGKFGKLFLYGGLATGYIIALVFAVMIFWPVTPITYTKGTFPFKVLNDLNADGVPEVAAGQILVYEVKYCRHTDAQAEVQRSLVGGVTVVLNRTSSQAEKGCARSVIANTIIPAYLPPGKYHMDIAVTYHINALKNVPVTTRTVDFMVVPAKVDANGNPVYTPLGLPAYVNKPGTINGGSLSDEDIRNQVKPPSDESQNPKQQQGR